MKEPKDTLNVGDRIRYYRQVQGLTLRELASLVGVSYQFIHMLENGKKHNTDKIPEFAAALGISVEELTES